MKIIITDNVLTGHHINYQNILTKLSNVEVKNYEINFTSLKKNIYSAYKSRKIYLKRILKEENNCLIHFLYIDSLYKCPWISLNLKNKNNIKYIGTLHWIPDSKFLILLLRNFSKRLEFIIVHSEYLKEQLNSMGIQNVKYIDYPSFISINNSKSKSFNEFVTVSCLGGTRYDKGLDVLLKSFEYLNQESKDKYLFNIAGIEQDVKYESIKNSALINKVHVNLKNKFLTEEEYTDEILKSDIILLPYKKCFKGNSGPMTDGIFANKFILGPDEGNLGYLIKKHKLGMTFKQENSADLGYTLNNLLNVNLRVTHEYSQELTIDRFLKKHVDLYNELKSNY